MGMLISKKTKDSSGKDNVLIRSNSNEKIDLKNVKIISEVELKEKRNSAYTYLVL
jgi:hypothetical protein